MGGDVNNISILKSCSNVDSTSVISDSIFVGDTISAPEGDTLSAKELIPDSLSVKVLSWKSENPKIASVDKNNGVIIAHNSGNCEIIGINDRGTIVKMHVKVSPSKESDIKLTSITMKPKQTTLKPSEEITIPVTLSPENATNQMLAWESSNPKIATVDSNGKIKAVSNGEVTITAKATDGGLGRASVRIKVQENVKASLKIKNPSTHVINLGETLHLKANVTPANTSITWSSDNKDVAFVNPRTGVVRAQKAGKARISVKLTNGTNLSDVVEIEVKEKLPTLTPTNEKELSYGVWHGKVEGGIPRGTGTITFTKKIIVQGDTYADIGYTIRNASFDIKGKVRGTLYDNNGNKVLFILNEVNPALNLK